MAHLNGDLVNAIENSNVIIANSNNYDNEITTNNLVYTDTSSNATTKDLVFATSSCELIAEDIFMPLCQYNMLHHTMTDQVTNQQPITEASVDFNATSETLVQTESPTKCEPSIVPCVLSHTMIHYIIPNKPNDTTCPNEPCSTLSEFVTNNSILSSLIEHHLVHTTWKT